MFRNHLQHDKSRAEAESLLFHVQKCEQIGEIKQKGEAPAGTNYVYQLHIIDSEIKVRLEGRLSGLTAAASSSNKLQNLLEVHSRFFPSLLRQLALCCRLLVLVEQ